MILARAFSATQRIQLTKSPACEHGCLADAGDLYSEAEEEFVAGCVFSGRIVAVAAFEGLLSTPFSTAVTR
jgi:hypothetical protein